MIRAGKIIIFCVFLCAQACGGNVLADIPVISGNLPEGVELTDDANSMTIDATSAANSITLNWTNFDIPQNYSVFVKLASQNSSLLNNVTGGSASWLDGNLFCPIGIFILTNPAGINIGKTANIDVANIILSTRAVDISNSDMLNGDFVFRKLSDETRDRLISNKGTIVIRNGGFGVLIAGAVENEGLISAPLGTVTLAGGDAARVGISNNGLISVAIEEKTASRIYDYEGKAIIDQIKNTGTIEASGGNIILKAESLPDIFESAVNLEGVVRANKVELRDGMVKVIANRDVMLAADIEATDIEIGNPDEEIPLFVNIKGGRLEAEKDIKIFSKTDISVTADISTADGDIKFYYDTDENGTGQFNQLSGTVYPGGDGSIYFNGIDFGKGLNLSGYPLYFIPNVGQVNNEDIQFFVYDGSSVYYFTSTEVYYLLFQEADGLFAWIPVSVEFLGADPYTEIGSYLAAGATYSYFIGNDPENHYTGIPSYYQIVYDELYPGIDLIYTSNKGNLESEFVIKPGADWQDILVQYNNAGDLTVDNNGNLVIQTPYGEIIETKPYAYQDIDGQRYDIEVAYELVSGDSYIFNVGSYNEDYPVIIDPELVYSTYVGGSGADYGLGVILDSQYNAYIAGQTYSNNFPVTLGSFETSYAGSGDGFVAKLSADGSALEYCAFLGGSGADICRAITIDSQRNVYVTGQTASNDFPVTPGAYDTTYNGSRDSFVARVNADGSNLEYCTYLGGSGVDYGYAIALDNSEYPCVSGSTESNNFPTTAGAYDIIYNGDQDIFVTKINADGSDLVSSTYIGGSDFEGGLGVAFDSSNNVYVTGHTDSANFPTTPGAYDTTWNGLLDVYVCKLSADFSALEYSTYIGGSGNDYGYGGISVSSGGGVYVTGGTYSVDFPVTPGAYDTTHNGGADIFVTRLKPAGNGPADMIFSTYVGGDGDDGGQGRVLDASGNIYVSGFTGSANFPTTPNAYDTSYNGGGGDAYMFKLDESGSSLKYSTYVGGTGYDSSYGGLTLDGLGYTYVIGYTFSADFPVTPGAYDTTHNGGSDVFVFRIGPFFFNSVDSATFSESQAMEALNSQLDRPFIGLPDSFINSAVFFEEGACSGKQEKDYSLVEKPWGIRRKHYIYSYPVFLLFSEEFVNISYVGTEDIL
ncbi:MAG: SBBP repeat-containing protein [bacterium]|nr:SBBP repeat-containing protein [bacterium]